MIDEKALNQIVTQLDEMLQVIAKLHDQAMTLRRKVRGENPVRNVLALYDELWINLYARGAAPVVHYAFDRRSDPAHVKRLLKQLPEPTLKGCVTKYFLDRDPFLVKNGHPFNLFLKRLPVYTATTTPPPIFTPAPAPAGCTHTPPCRSAKEHTDRKLAGLREVLEND